MKLHRNQEKNCSIENIYQLNGTVPIYKAIPFGLQHILAMFVANIAPILIVGGACGLADKELATLIQSAMLIAGIGTLVQLFPIFHKIGSGLPIVMGISFTFVSVLCVVGTQYGYGAIMGAVLIGGIVEGILGLFAKFWLKIIAPIVSASVVTAIGFSLLTVGANSFGGGSGSENFGSVENWILGSVTLLCCILFHIFAKGYLKQRIGCGLFAGAGAGSCGFLRTERHLDHFRTASDSVFHGIPFGCHCLGGADFLGFCHGDHWRHLCACSVWTGSGGNAAGDFRFHCL